MSQRMPVAASATAFWPDVAATIGSGVRPSRAIGRRGCSMNATWRQVLAPSAPVLSYDMPSISSPSSGMRFHSLHATSQALQPMQTELSVKNPLRDGAPIHPVSAAGFDALDHRRITGSPQVG
jgi:hypothetical protein